MSAAHRLSFPVLHETAVYSDYLAITLGQRQVRTNHSPFMALLCRFSRLPGMPDALIHGDKIQVHAVNEVLVLSLTVAELVLVRARVFWCGAL